MSFDEKVEKITLCVNVLTDIVKRVNEAKSKHPMFAVGRYQALDVIEEELKEFSHAVFHESEERQRDEALDVIATCFRFLCGEHKQEPQK